MQQSVKIKQVANLIHAVVILFSDYPRPDHQFIPDVDFKELVIGILKTNSHTPC
jgi:hypothetical protein